jgi:hypothetical protein
MTMFGQSLTLGAVVYAMPLNGAFEFTLMAGGYQSQPQGQTQLTGFHYGNGTFHIWKNCELQILNGSGGVNDHKPVNALHSQTFCNVHGSLFMAGGTLVVYLRRRSGVANLKSPRTRLWLGARSISSWTGAPYAQPGGLRSSRTRSHPARFAPAS